MPPRLGAHRTEPATRAARPRRPGRDGLRREPKLALNLLLDEPAKLLEELPHSRNSLFTPTAKTNAEEWPILAQRLAGRTLVLPPHARLREELLNLVVGLGPTGIKVVDRGQVHQDHAVAVRGVVTMLLDGPSSAIPQATNLAPTPYKPVDWEREFGRFTTGFRSPRDEFGDP